MQELEDRPSSQGHRLGWKCFPLFNPRIYSSPRNKPRGAKGPNQVSVWFLLLPSSLSQKEESLKDQERGEFRASQALHTGPTLTQAQEPSLTLASDQIFFFFSFRACSQLGDDPSDLEDRVQRSQGEKIYPLARRGSLGFSCRPGTPYSM